MASSKSTTTDVVQEASSSSKISPRIPTPEGAGRVDDRNAVSPSPASCQLSLASPSESDSDREVPESSKPAKRKRYAQEGAVEFEIVNRLCFKGGFLKQLIVLDTTLIQGTHMLKIGGRAASRWIVQAATGWTERRGTFEMAVKRVKSQLHAAIAVAYSALQMQKINVAESGRNLLNLADDSDSSASSGESNQCSKPKVDNLLLGTLLTVEFKGEKFKAISIKERGTTNGLLYVEALATVAKTIVSACLDQVTEMVQEETKDDVAGHPSAKPLVTVLTEGEPNTLKESHVPEVPDGLKVHEGSEVPAASLEPEGPGVANPSSKCIRFCGKRNCYEVTYRKVVDGESKTFRSINGLTVKSHYKCGKKLPPTKEIELMNKMHEKAKKLWNELDQTNRARFE